LVEYNVNAKFLAMIKNELVIDFKQ